MRTKLPFEARGSAGAGATGPGLATTPARIRRQACPHVDSTLLRRGSPRAALDDALFGLALALLFAVVCTPLPGLLLRLV